MRQPKIFTTLRSYDRGQFVGDLMAGITVALVALPLSLAIAIASGAEPAAGLITAVIGGGLISALGGSRVQIGGPTGAFIVVVFGVIADHGYDGLMIATFMAGCILLIAGFFRAGRLVAYIPEAVVNGFTIGIAIIIATSQIKDFLGIEVTALPADFLEKIPVLWAERGSLNPSALGIALLSLVLIVMFRRLAPRLPGMIVAVAIGSVLVAILHLPVDTIASRFGALPESLPLPSLPVLSWARVVELTPSALVIAFLAGIESLLSAMVADRMIEGHHRPNAELTAQGAANIGAAIFGGLPATGAIARTATNIKAGGKTPVAGIVHAVIVLLAILFAGPLTGHLAMPVLSALLIITAWNMSEPHKWRGYLQTPMSDRVILLLTLVLTVFLDLTIAIGTGVGLGLAFRYFRKNKTEADWTPPKR